MTYQAKLRVWRGDDEGGGLQDYEVGVNEGEVVLDIIHRLQAEQTPDLAVRWNCKAGKCGSCSAEINGRPRLMCMTRMSTFDESETVTITPLRTFPVIRDLVTDVSFNYDKAREIPAFAPPKDLQPGEYRMAQIDVERSQEFRKCIECFLCQNVCHVVRDHEENKKAFAGPRFLMRVAELDMHPLDTLDRKDMAQEDFGLGYCNITKCCTEVCPEHIGITDNGIIPLKERVVDRYFDPITVIGRKLFGNNALVRIHRSITGTKAKGGQPKLPPSAAAGRCSQLRIAGLEAVLDRSGPGTAEGRASADHDRADRTIGNVAAAAQVVAVEHVVALDAQLDVFERHDPEVHAKNSAARILTAGIVDDARLAGDVQADGGHRGQARPEGSRRVPAAHRADLGVPGHLGRRGRRRGG